MAHQIEDSTMVDFIPAISTWPTLEGVRACERDGQVRLSFATGSGMQYQWLPAGQATDDVHAQLPEIAPVPNYNALMPYNKEMAEAGTMLTEITEAIAIALSKSYITLMGADAYRAGVAAVAGNGGSTPEIEVVDGTDALMRGLRELADAEERGW